MSEVVVAKRYADALFQLGLEKNTLDQLEKEFSVIQEVFNQNKQINTFLMHPKVNNEKKKQLVTDVFQGMQADVVNTIKLLVERRRIAAVSSIIENFIQLVNDAKGTADATVYSVRELTDSEKQELQQTFAKRIGKTAIHFKNIVDPSILGGIKIRIGNTIYDGTISRKLDRISRSIVSAN